MKTCGIYGIFLECFSLFAVVFIFWMAVVGLVALLEQACLCKYQSVVALLYCSVGFLFPLIVSVIWPIINQSTRK